MVLEFGLLKSIFPASSAAGEGLSPDPLESVRHDVVSTLSMIYSDDTGDTWQGTAERTNASYQMPAGTVKNGVIIMAQGSGRGFNAGGNSRLMIYVGAPGAEVLQETQVIGISDHGYHNLSVAHIELAQDWNSIVSIEVRGKNNVNNVNDKTNYKNVVVLGF